MKINFTFTGDIKLFRCNSFYLLNLCQTAYPTVRTIQTTQQVGNLQQQILNPVQLGTTQYQGIRTIQHQPTSVGNTQVIRSTQPSAVGASQPRIIQMTQLQPGEKQVSMYIVGINFFLQITEIICKLEGELFSFKIYKAETRTSKRWFRICAVYAAILMI